MSKVTKVNTILYLTLRKNIRVYDLRKPSTSEDKTRRIEYYISKLYAYKIFLYLTSFLVFIKNLPNFIRTKTIIEENIEVITTPKKLRFIDIDIDKKYKGD
ncbi:hypothetical protein KVT40_007438 [Elsinoe batatas]|uniref:Uncharacterized protein n=1 Tax=Elsinoe batatas TaxID=2601811 RepID=A0A8K0KUQ5_9PEZI|nr:hypothetical protein KVT40_007438 [Elsinoe batatas]